MEEAKKLLWESSGAAEALGWFNKVFPPETRVDSINSWLEIAQPYLVAGAAVAVVAVLLRFCCCGGGGGGDPARMMKAPGRNYRMPRAGFEEDPKSYFRDLRARK